MLGRVRLEFDMRTTVATMYVCCLLADAASNGWILPGGHSWYGRLK